MQENAVTNLDEEEKGFNARVQSLVPPAPPAPFEEEDTPVVPPELESSAADDGASAPEKAEDDGGAAAAEAFLGDLTAEQVLEKLMAIDGIEDRIQEQVVSRVFGKFGEVGQRLKALEEKDFEFNPEALAALKEVDEGVHDALVTAFPKAFAAHRVDTEALKKTISEEILGTVSPALAEQIVLSNVPDAEEISKSKEFADWFTKSAPAETKQAFVAWDAGEQRDAVAVVRGYRMFEKAQAEKAKATAAKNRAVESSAENPRSRSTTSAKAEMSETDAFNARATELKR